MYTRGPSHFLFQQYLKNVILWKDRSIGIPKKKTKQNKTKQNKKTINWAKQPKHCKLWLACFNVFDILMCH